MLGFLFLVSKYVKKKTTAFPFFCTRKKIKQTNCSTSILRGGILRRDFSEACNSTKKTTPLQTGTIKLN